MYAYIACAFDPAVSMLPIVEAHPLGTGPFADDLLRIKQRRILRT